jgi:hypothetical protein
MKSLIGSTLLAAALLTGCSDAGPVKSSELTFITLPATAPALCADSTGAWFKNDPNGPDSTITLDFPAQGAPLDCSGSTEQFLSLRIRKGSLLRLPNNNLIPVGDSVFIWAKWVGNDSILFDLQPSGLTFDPANPASLQLEYAEAGDDLNHDHRVDNADTTIAKSLDIWRQERPVDAFVRVGTVHNEDAHEIEAKLNGFSRFAIAY